MYIVLVGVDKFIFSIDFVIFDYKIDNEVLIILGRTFLAIKRELEDMEYGQINFRVNNEEVTSKVCKSMKQPKACK